MSLGLAVTCIILVALDLRPGLVSVGPMLPSVRAYFHLSHTVAALLTSIPDLLLGLMAFPAPWLSRRFGRDRVIIAALLVLGASTAARALAPSTFVLLATTAGVGVGIAVSQSLVASFVKASFPHIAALMIGIYATSLSIGSALAAGLTGPVIHWAGDNWRYGAGIWSLLGITAIGAWMIIARRTHGAKRFIQAPHRIPWGSGKAWLLAAYFGCQNFIFYSVISWTAPFFVERGSSSTHAGLILAAFTIVFTIANPIYGSFSKSTDRRRWIALSGVSTALGTAGIALIPSLSPFIYMSLIAIGLAGAFTLGMTLPLDNTANEGEATAWNAFVMMIAYVVAAFGPLLVGVFRDLTGDFHVSMLLLFAVALIMLALAPFLKPRDLSA